MKKKWMSILLLALTLSVMAGCDDQASSKKTEEDESKTKVEQSASADNAGKDSDGEQASGEEGGEASNVSDGGDVFGNETNDDVYVLKVVQTKDDGTEVETGQTFTYPMNRAYRVLKHDTVDERDVENVTAMLDLFTDADFSYEMRTNTIEINGLTISLPCTLGDLLPEDQLDEDTIKVLNYKAKHEDPYNPVHTTYDKLVEPIAKEGEVYPNFTIYYKDMEEEPVNDYKSLVVYGIMIEPVNSGTGKANDTIQSFNVAGITKDSKFNDVLSLYGEDHFSYELLHGYSNSTFTWFDVEDHLMVQVMDRGDGVLTHIFVGEQKLSYDYQILSYKRLDDELFKNAPVLREAYPKEMFIDLITRSCPRFLKK